MMLILHNNEYMFHNEFSTDVTKVFFFFFFFKTHADDASTLRITNISRKLAVCYK